ncbi:MAG TPA: WYL domain-containing protein [Chloroflexaceae bacterium]|nr:WYL domain-containing protein [Chloroflexaceae bacterium]
MLEVSVPDDIPENVERLTRLRDLLWAGPQSIAEIIDLLTPHYLPGETGQRLLRRDLRSLETMGYVVIREGKPVRISITSGPTVLADRDVDALTYIRDMFVDSHPLAPMIRQLLERLTSHLPPRQQGRWQRRPVLRIQLTPALDYSAHGDLLRWLDQAITDRSQIRFLYRARASPKPILHERLDPYDIEYTDRHFFLLAYSHSTGSVLTFRIDRIVVDATQPSPERLPGLQAPRRTPRPIHFTYRLPASFAEGGVSERFTTHSVRRAGEYVLVEASDTSAFRIMRTLLGYGEHAVLMDGPPGLLAQMRTAVAQMAANYEVGQ